MSRMTSSIIRIKQKLDSISGLDCKAADIMEDCIEPIVSLVCDYVYDEANRELPDPIPYENLKHFVKRPVFIVDGNVRCWTICNRVGKEFACFSESVNCGVYLMKEGCGVTWFPYEFEPKETY